MPGSAPLRRRSNDLAGMKKFGAKTGDYFARAGVSDEPGARVRRGDRCAFGGGHTCADLKAWSALAMDGSHGSVSRGRCRRSARSAESDRFQCQSFSLSRRNVTSL